MSLESPDPPLVSPFPPIADYGFLSDCETCALVAPSGAIEWMCLPRYDGPSVFGAPLDRAARGCPCRWLSAPVWGGRGGGGALVARAGGGCGPAPGNRLAPPPRRYLP